MLIAIAFFLLGLWFAALVPLFAISVVLEVLRHVLGCARPGR